MGHVYDGASAIRDGSMLARTAGRYALKGAGYALKGAGHAAKFGARVMFGGHRHLLAERDEHDDVDADLDSSDALEEEGDDADSERRRVTADAARYMGHVYDGASAIRDGSMLARTA